MFNIKCIRISVKQLSSRDQNSAVAFSDYVQVSVTELQLGVSDWLN